MLCYALFMQLMFGFGLWSFVVAFCFLLHVPGEECAGLDLASTWDRQSCRDTECFRSLNDLSSSAKWVWDVKQLLCWCCFIRCCRVLPALLILITYYIYMHIILHYIYIYIVRFRSNKMEKLEVEVGKLRIPVSLSGWPCTALVRMARQTSCFKQLNEGG